MLSKIWWVLSMYEQLGFSGTALLTWVIICFHWCLLSTLIPHPMFGPPFHRSSTNKCATLDCGKRSAYNSTTLLDNLNLRGFVLWRTGSFLPISGRLTIGNSSSLSSQELPLLIPSLDSPAGDCKGPPQVGFPNFTSYDLSNSKWHCITPVERITLVYGTLGPATAAHSGYCVEYLKNLPLLLQLLSLLSALRDTWDLVLLVLISLTPFDSSS